MTVLKSGLKEELFIPPQIFMPGLDQKQLLIAVQSLLIGWLFHAEKGRPAQECPRNNGGGVGGMKCFVGLPTECLENKSKLWSSSGVYWSHFSYNPPHIPHITARGEKSPQSVWPHSCTSTKAVRSNPFVNKGTIRHRPEDGFTLLMLLHVNFTSCRMALWNWSNACFSSCLLVPGKLPKWNVLSVCKLIHKATFHMNISTSFFFFKKNLDQSVMESHP